MRPRLRRSATLELATRREAWFAAGVARDQKGARRRAAEVALERLGGLGDAEGELGLAVEPGDGIARDEPRLARILGSDRQPRQVDERLLVALRDGQRQRHRARGHAIGARAAGQRTL